MNRRKYGGDPIGTTWSSIASGGDIIEILRVVHGARDYERLLSPDKEPPP
jgi:plasmid stabilization system protein ParE